MKAVAKRNAHKTDSELKEYLRGKHWNEDDIDKIINYVNRYLRKECSE